MFQRGFCHLAPGWQAEIYELGRGEPVQASSFASPSTACALYKDSFFRNANSAVEICNLQVSALPKAEGHVLARLHRVRSREVHRCRCTKPTTATTPPNTVPTPDWLPCKFQAWPLGSALRFFLEPGTVCDETR